MFGIQTKNSFDDAFTMPIPAWHVLLLIFLRLINVYCDGATASIKLFLDQECSQAKGSASETQLNICIVISGVAAGGVTVEGHNPCDSGFIFITGYLDSFCINVVMNQGPNNTIPDRCFSGDGSNEIAAIHVYCIAHMIPLSTTTLSAISITPFSTTISYVSGISSGTTTTQPTLHYTYSSSKTNLPASSGAPYSSTATVLTASERPSFLKPTAQSVSGSPSPFPTTTAGVSGGSNTSSDLRNYGKVVVGVSIGVSVTALVVGFLAWVFPNPCNREQHSIVDEDHPRQHRRHGFPQSRSRISADSSRQEMNSSLEPE